MQADRELRNGWEARAILVCTLCTRTVGWAHGSNADPASLTSIRVLEASHADAVRRLRCPHCLGRLWLQDRHEVYVIARALKGFTDTDLRPRRGRPPKLRRIS